MSFLASFRDAERAKHHASQIAVASLVIQAVLVLGSVLVQVGLTTCPAR
jgi:hypothetical protein